jgi:hypothetical protein
MLPLAIRAERTTWAAEREMAPNQLVQAVFWKALTDRRLSMP